MYYDFKYNCKTHKTIHRYIFSIQLQPNGLYIFAVIKIFGINIFSGWYEKLTWLYIETVIPLVHHEIDITWW